MFSKMTMARRSVRLFTIQEARDRILADADSDSDDIDLGESLSDFSNDDPASSGSEYDSDEGQDASVGDNRVTSPKTRAAAVDSVEKKSKPGKKSISSKKQSVLGGRAEPMSI